MDTEDKNWNPEKTNVDQQLNFLFGSSKINPSQILSSFTSSVAYAPTIYELQLQKYESDIRNMIKTENEQRIIIDDLKVQIDKYQSYLKKFDARFQEAIDENEQSYNKKLEHKNVEITILKKKLSEKVSLLDEANQQILLLISDIKEIKQIHEA